MLFWVLLAIFFREAVNFLLYMSQKQVLPPWIPCGPSKSHVFYGPGKDKGRSSFTRQTPNLDEVLEKSEQDYRPFLTSGGHYRGNGHNSMPTTHAEILRNNQTISIEEAQQFLGDNPNDETLSFNSDSLHDSIGASNALRRTSAHRKYGLVTMRSSATHFNKRAMESFSERLSSCFNKFHDHSASTRESLYREVEEQTSRAIRSMEQEVRDIQKEVEERFRKEEEVTKDDLFARAFASMNRKYPEAEVELADRIRSQGADVVARQRAHEQMQAELKQREYDLTEEHRSNLEGGAQARLQEREAQLATQRAKIQVEMEELQRNKLAELSEKLSREAKDQIAAYRLELENLREARVTSAREKEAGITEKLLQDLKVKFMTQAEEEVRAASIHEEDEERVALTQVQEEISRFQALKATEITTNARAHRAQTLPSMAIELEERAEGIERNFR